MHEYQLAPHLRLASDRAGSRVLVLGEGVGQVLEDPNFVVVLKRLPCVDPPCELIDAGILVRTVPPSEPFWASTGLPTQPCRVRRICLGAAHSAGCDVLEKALLCAGFELASTGADLDLVAVDDYLVPLLAQVNRERVGSPKPWMPIKLTGHTMWLGPVFGVPGRPCWDCLAARIRANRWVAGLLDGLSPSSFPRETATDPTPLTLSLGASTAATILGTWARNSEMWNLDDNVVTFDTRNLAYTHHPVSQRPQCAACGSLKRPLASPAGVLLERIVSPISGIVTGLTVTSQPVLGHYHARTEVCSPAPQSPDRPIIRPSVSIGKHPSREIARQVALGEAVERYSIVFQGDEPEHVAKEAELPSIPLARLSEFSAAQFANRDSINPSAFDRSHIPIELGPSQIIRWTSGRYLLAKRGDVFLPSCFCYMGHPESSYCQADTNGCAAAPTIDQALVAALYELIERDAAGIWWFNRISRPLVEAASLADPQILTFVADFHKAGRTLHLLDIRADLPLPVFAAVSTLPDGSEIMLGLGCRPSAASAARHAISELSQVCHWLGQRPPGPGLWRRWLDTATLANQPYLAGGPPEKPTLDWPTDGSHQPIVEMLEKYGFTPAMVDLSRPDLPLKVVRAVVPGFAHFWPRLGSRRLYEVPVRLGWLDQSRDESDLNSLPCPL